VIKDHHQKLVQRNQISQSAVTPSKSHLDDLRNILDLFDESGEFNKYLDIEFLMDPPKMERMLRADKVNQKISFPKFFAYSKARSISFARKVGNLAEWVAANTYSENKMTPCFMDILAFLAYEIVSQMVDLAFVVRRDGISTSNEMNKLGDPRVANPETCMSGPAFQVVSVLNQPSGIFKLAFLPLFKITDNSSCFTIETKG